MELWTVVHHPSPLAQDADVDPVAAGAGPTAATGSAVLDEALDGGLPRRRSTLVIGGPGTGKSTLAMQFLQEGLAAGEACLLISTEQTTEELLDSFGRFPYELDHEQLTLTSVHAVADRDLENDHVLTIKTLDGGELIDAGFGIPFTPTYLRDTLLQYGPVDRVVLDSASGLAALGDDESLYRRAILDVIRLFTDEFDATSMIVSEGRPGNPDAVGGRETLAGDELLQFSTHGVIRLWRDALDGDFHRFLRIEKMRGVDHDTRRFKIVIEPSTGVRIVPHRRALPAEVHRAEPFETNVQGLDALLGGGLPRGEIALLEHDGLANTGPLLYALINEALGGDAAVVLLPPLDLRLGDLAAHLRDGVGPIETLFEGDRLFVIDPVRPPHDAHRNVFHVSGAEAYESALRTIDERTSGQARFGVFDFDTLLHKVPSDRAEAITRESIAMHLSGDDTVVATLNTEGDTESLRVFMEDTAQQVLRVHQEPDGLEIVKLAKASAAPPGQSRVIGYTDEPPYIQLS